jgi:asparagine synthase (glutamine-hydrolysing)
MPAAAWFRTDLREFVRDTLLSRDSACRNYFDQRAIEEIVTRQEEGKISGYQEIWSLIVFEYWHKYFIEQSERPRASTGTDVVLKLQGHYVS